MNDAHRPRMLLFAGVWLVGFFVYFFSLDLPNNQGYPRSRVWLDLPDLLSSVSVSGPNNGWRYLPQRFDVWLVAGAILAGAWGIGHLALRFIGVGLPRRSSERTVFAFGLGLSALSLTTLGFGLLGWQSRVLFGALICAAVSFECFFRWRGLPKDGDRMTEFGTGNRDPNEDSVDALLKAGCLAAISPFVLAMLLGATLPSTDFDVNEYHLQGPKEFYQNGRVTFLPHNVYTSFPFLTEMLSLLAMVLRGDWFRGALAGKVVLMAFAPLTALALYAAGRRWFHPAAGWLAATIFLTTPWIYRISTIAYAEGGLTCYLFVSLLAVGIAVEQIRAKQSATATCLLAGLLAGSAMACKYPGVLSVVIPLGLCIVWASLFQTQSRRPLTQQQAAGNLPADSVLARLKPALVFSLGVAMAVGPWLLKNLVETGNPVYPLMYTLFGGADWDANLNAQWRDGHRPDDHNLAKLPFWLTDVSARNDWLSPLLYGFAPLAFFWRSHRRSVATLWLYVFWLFATWWLFTHRLDRFWVPMIPVVALLAGIGATWCSRQAWILVGTTAVAAAVLFNLGFVVSGAAGYNAYLVDLDYARGWTAKEFAPTIAFLNQELSEGDRALCVGEAQVFDAKFDLVYNTAFDRSIFQEWFAVPQDGVPESELRLRPVAEIREKLDDEQITHVLVNWREVLRYRRTYGHTAFVTPNRFTKLQQSGLLGSPRLPSYLPFDDLGEADQREIESWAPELIVSSSGRKIFIAAQLYPVTRSEAAD